MLAWRWQLFELDKLAQMHPASLCFWGCGFSLWPVRRRPCAGTLGHVPGGPLLQRQLITLSRHNGKECVMLNEPVCHSKQTVYVDAWGASLLCLCRLGSEREREFCCPSLLSVC